LTRRPAAKPVKIAFGSATEKLIPGFLDRMAAIAPEFDLFVVCEFPPSTGRWIPYRVDRSILNNYRRCKDALRGRRIAYAGVVLEPKSPYRPMRAMAMLFAPARTLFFNENLDHFMLRPRGVVTMLRHLAWRARSVLSFELRPGGNVYTWAWRFRHPRELRWPVFAALARMAGKIAAIKKRNPAGPTPAPAPSLPQGISVVIPSRNGRPLLEKLLPMLSNELAGLRSEVIVVDNGSGDGSAEFVREHYSTVRVEYSDEALSFAKAVNRGVAAAQFSHICLLNNDMALHGGFFTPLLDAFNRVPDLFCATAQIFFPAGLRREETGKAVFRWPLPESSSGFPVLCVDPLAGEDLS
jgi:hypothetical protein